MRWPRGVALLLALLASGCADALPSQGVIPSLSVDNLPSPFQRVLAGSVATIVPDGWTARVAGDPDDARIGVLATPAAGDVSNGDIEGMAALWVDAARIGVASDFYYLAATRSLGSLLPDGVQCDATGERIHVDHAPDALTGAPSSGDFIADAWGRCSDGDIVVRWRSYVIAPGFGAAHAIGIPRSGLYVVVAVLRDQPSVGSMLRRILARTEFAGASMPDFVEAVEATA